MKEKDILRGLIIPFKYKEDMSISSVSVATDNEEEYRIKMKRGGRQMIKHAGQFVRIEGKVRRLKKGTPIIQVEEFEILEKL